MFLNLIYVHKLFQKGGSQSHVEVDLGGTDLEGGEGIWGGGLGGN